MKTLLDEDEGMVVWWMTRSECYSALARRKREGAINTLSQAKAVSILYRLEQSWTQFLPGLYGMRARAEGLLDNYPLRTADAYQLAAAQEWRESRAQGTAGFVCLNDPLRDAAENEGFSVLPT